MVGAGDAAIENAVALARQNKVTIINRRDEFARAKDGNLSLITITEHQVDYVISMLDKMKADGLAAIAARQSAFDDYNSAMGEAIKDTTWYTGGCDSWYIDRSGVPNLYPWSPARYLREMHSPDFSEYHLIG